MPKKDLYTCPKGELLVRRGYDHRERSVRYAARPFVCNACSLKARCTKSTKGRWIRRSFEEEYLERVRTYRNTESYRKAMRKRAVWVEPLFGEAKDWHGARRFRLRRLEKVNAEALLKAAGQNIKRLLTFSKRGPSRPAQVSALGQLAPNPYGFCGVRRHRKRCLRRPLRVFQHAVSILGEASREASSTVPHQSNLGHNGQTVNARACAYPTCCALQTLVARQCKGRGFRKVYC